MQWQLGIMLPNAVTSFLFKLELLQQCHVLISKQLYFHLPLVKVIYSPSYFLLSIIFFSLLSFFPLKYIGWVMYDNVLYKCNCYISCTSYQVHFKIFIYSAHSSDPLWLKSVHCVCYMKCSDILWILVIFLNIAQ